MAASGRRRRRSPAITTTTAETREDALRSPPPSTPVWTREETTSALLQRRGLLTTYRLFSDVVERHQRQRDTAAARNERAIMCARLVMMQRESDVGRDNGREIARRDAERYYRRRLSIVRVLVLRLRLEGALRCDVPRLPRRGATIDGRRTIRCGGRAAGDRRGGRRRRHRRGGGAHVDAVRAEDGNGRRRVLLDAAAADRPDAD